MTIAEIIKFLIDTADDVETLEERMVMLSEQPGECNAETCDRGDD